MAENDEVFKLILTIEGEDDVARLQAAVSLADQKLRAMIDNQKSIGGASATASAAIRDQAAVVAGLTTQLSGAESALASLGGGRGKNSSQALLEFSRAAEDAQYGIAGVLNNIPGLVTAMGGGAGLVGVLSLAAVGGAQLYKHWDELMGLFAGGLPQPALTGPELLAENLKKASTEMETLSKKASLTWYEVARLGTLKDQVKELQQQQKNEKDVEGILGIKPAEVKKQGDAFKKAIEEVGGPAAFDEIRSGLSENADAKGMVFNPVTRKMASPKDVANDLLRTATEGDDYSIAEIKNSLKAGSAFGKAIESNSVVKKQADDESREDEFLANTEQTHAYKYEEYVKAQEEKRLDEEAKALDEEQKRNMRAWDDQVKEASRTKSFLTTPEDQMTPAQKAAKQQYDEREQGKRAEAAGKARTDAPGLDDYIRDALLSGASGNQLGGLLSQLGFSQEESAGLLGRGQKDAYEQMLKGEKESRSETIGNGAALRDAIQGGVSNRDTGREQVQRLMAIEGYLRDIATETRSSPGATFA